MTAKAKLLVLVNRKSPFVRPAMSLLRFFQFRRQYKALETLPDYLLRDVGLTRADIARASHRNRPF